MAITWGGTEIRDYLITKGFTSAVATFYQTYVARVTGIFTDVARDSSLVKEMEAVIKPTLDIAAGTYGLGLDAAGVRTWMSANRPDLSPAWYNLVDDIVVTDLNTNLVGTPSAVDSLGAKATYVRNSANVLTIAARNMRYFAGMPLVNGSSAN